MDAVDDWVTAPAATAAAPEGKDDWVTAPAAKAEHWAAPAGGEFGDLVAQSAAPALPQGQVAADLNSVGQGLVSGTGSAIAGAGRIAQAGSGPWAEKVLKSFDLVDEGKNRDAYQQLSDAQRQQVGAYRGSRPENRAEMRAALQQSIDDYGKPNALTNAGMAVEGAAPQMFPVDPANEGIQTGVGRLIGGAAPILATGAVGGPVGLLASLATIGSQAYDGAYQDAVSKGASHEEADDAAGKSAITQAALMVAPVGRLIQRVPMPLRDGLTKTLVNLGQHGVEFGSANALGTFANNYVAQQTYDPSRSLTQGTGQAGIEGTIAGLIIPTVAGAVRGARTPTATVADIGKAPDIDGAIAAAGEASRAPATETTSGTTAAGTFETSVTSEDPATRAAVLAAGGTADGAGPGMNWGDLFTPKTAGDDSAPLPTGWSVDDRFGSTQPTQAAAPVPQSAGAAASRDMTNPAHIEAPPAEAAANRAQGEVERLALPPAMGDRNIYIPGSKPTLAEVSGKPNDAMDQAYNRQQPESMTQHIAQENHNADAVADYYADTAGSAPTLLRMERARDATAQSNIQSVFGDPQSVRAPADPSPTINLMDGMLTNPRQAERNSVVKILSSLAEKFYGEDGNMKTDPYALYGIGEHINDLLRGTGDTETNGAARVLKRELVQIKESLYSDIEDAAPGFAKYRADYQRDSQAIDAMQILQDARLSLLSGTNQHITPAKWFGFMRNIVEGRADPMDAASALSEAQMDRLWNITDHMKRTTLIDAGKPRGSWTSMMQEWGGRFARLGAHGIAGYTAPLIGNLAVEMGVAGLRKRSVGKEMNRVLNPDLGQPQP